MAKETTPTSVLAELRGPVIDAALIYTPSALTTLTLRGSTTMK